MSDGIALNPTAARDLLRTMAERNQSLDLVRILDSGEDRCRSRFIEVPGNAPAIEVPSRQGHLVPVRAGEQVEVFFRSDDLRYQFVSTVTGRDKVKLSSDLTLGVLLLETPQRVNQRQRRQHFRVNLPKDDRLMADLWRIDVEADSDPSPLPSMEVLDLSAGGMRLLYDQSKDCPVADGDTIRVSLSLDEAKPAQIIDACAVRATSTVKKVTQLGVEFAGLDDSPEGRLTRSALTQFVTRREREELRRMRAKK